MASLQEQSADLFGKNPELKYKTVEEIKENVGQTPYKPTLKELAKDLYIPASFLPVIGTGIAIKEMPEVAQQAYTLLKQGKSESDLIKMGLGAGLGVLVAADVLPYAKKVTDPLKSKIKNVASQMSDTLTPQAVTPEGISADIPKVDSKILKNEKYAGLPNKDRKFLQKIDAFLKKINQPKTKPFTELTLYHGSSANFDKFNPSMTKQAAFGHGINLSNKENIGEFFAKQVKKGKRGNIYKTKVSIKPDELLDYDKPIHQQPKGLQEKVKKLRKHIYDAGFQTSMDNLLKSTYKPEEITGKVIYRKVGTYGKLSDKEISNKLSEFGIKGLKHKAGFLQGATDEDAINYVIFDSDLIDIVEKNKKPVVKTKSPSNINKINNVQLLEDFPRYVYHSSRGVRDTSEGIKKYEHRDFGEKGLNLPKGKGIYLSQEPFQPDAIKIDITKLPINSRKDISYTGQAEGYIYSTVDIPKEAIVKTKSPLRVIFDRLPEDVKKSIPKQKDSTGLTGYHGTASSRKKGEPFFDRDFISKTDQLLDEGFYFTLNPKKAAEYANMRGIKGQSFLENDAMSRRRILSGENVKYNKQTNPTTKPAFLLKTKDGEIATSASLLKGEDIYGNPISAGQSISRFDLSNLEKPYIVKHYTGSDKKLLAQAKRDKIKLKKNIQKIKEDEYDSVIFEDFKDGSMQIMVFPEHINKIKSFNKGGIMKNEMKKLKLKGGALVSSTALLGEILPSKSQ